MKIRDKIILSFAAVGLSIALASYIVIHSIEKGPENIAEFQTQKLYLIQEMSTSIEEALYHSVIYMLDADRDNKEEFYKYTKKFDMTAAEFRKIIMAGAIRNEKERGLFDDLFTGRNDIVEKAEKMFIEIEAGRPVQREALVEYSKLIEDLDSNYEELTEIEKGNVEKEQKASLDAINSAYNAHSLIVIFSILSSVVMGWLISRTISTPIGKLKKAAASIAQGDIDVTIEINHKKDEIGALANAFQAMKENLIAAMQTLRSEITERIQAENEIKKINETLEQRVMERTIYLELANEGLEKAALNLEEKETHLRTILDNVFESIFTVDESYLITSCNLATEHIYGWKTDELIGKHISILGLEDFLSGDSKAIISCLQEDNVKIADAGHKTIVKRKDGSTFPAEFAFKEVHLQGKRMFICIVRDITEGEKIDSLKNEFISTVSHELRTPLTSIIGSLGLVASGLTGELPPKAKEMIGIAYKNSNRLTNLVNDILDIQKIESGRMVFDIKPVELMPLLVQSIEANKAYAQLFRVRLVLVCDLYGLKVDVDVDRFIQVITNLISNAVKFSPPDNTVTVSASINGDKIHIAVTDHGPGITEEFHSRIFQKFSQADSSLARQKGGTGLGLSIAKAIVEKHGGKIGFESEPNAATAFWFDLERAVKEE